MIDMLWTIIDTHKDCKELQYDLNFRIMKKYHTYLEKELEKIYFDLIDKLCEYFSENNPFDKYENISPDDPALKYGHWDGFHCGGDTMLMICDYIISQGQEKYNDFMNNPSQIEHYYKRQVSCHCTMGMFIDVYPSKLDIPYWKKTYMDRKTTIYDDICGDVYTYGENQIDAI